MIVLCAKVSQSKMAGSKAVNIFKGFDTYGDVSVDQASVSTKGTKNRGQVSSAWKLWKNINISLSLVNLIINEQSPRT
jgi:hypothetical protein